MTGSHQDADREWRYKRAHIHHNARVQRRDFCDWCAHAVPDEDFSTKFAAAGGVLAGPFCSSRCYWHFIKTNEWHDKTRQERRQWYNYEGETV